MEGEEEVIKEKEASSVRAESPSQSDKERARRIYLNSPIGGMSGISLWRAGEMSA